MLIIMKQS